MWRTTAVECEEGRGAWALKRQKGGRKERGKGGMKKGKKGTGLLTSGDDED